MNPLAIIAMLCLAACAPLSPQPPHLVTYHQTGKEVFRVEIQPVGNSSIITGAAGMIGALVSPLLSFLGL